MIQAIVYDAVGTLIHVQPSVAQIYAAIAEQFGSRFDAVAIQRRFHAAFSRQDQRDEEAGWLTSEAREMQRWREIVAEVLDDVAKPAACFDAIFEAFKKPEAWTYDRCANDLLAGLNQRGIRQSMASNFDARLHALIASMPIAAYLNPVIISSEVGWRKPAPEFFSYLMDALRLPAEAILFVGDDRVNDYAAACAAGMKSLLLDPKKRHLDLKADRIGRLDELLQRI